MADSHALRISASASDQALTSEQKRFNTLVRQIERARRTLAALNDSAGPIERARVDVLAPIGTQLKATVKQLVLALDAAHGGSGWTRTERETLSELICEAITALLSGDDTDTELKALFQKHADVDFDADRQAFLHSLKNLTTAVTGMDLGDDAEIRSEADLLARLQKGLEAQAAADTAARDAKSTRRRPTAAAQRRATESQMATKSVREVYRKLASAWHPDRETDPEERERKTALMQKVNQAYAGNDLLTLLELQLQIEQVDAAHIAHANNQRVKHYNKVLSEQLAELKAEIEHVEMQIAMQLGLMPDARIDPDRLGGLIDRIAADMRAELARHELELKLLADRAAAKRWLKRERKRLRDTDPDFDLF